MADDFISFVWDASEFFAMTDEIGPITRRATMYAMRATGRFIARTAKTKAPVYKGSDDPRAMAESGNLRKSIKNARVLRTAGDMYELKVGPFGTKKQGTAVVRHGTGPHPSVRTHTSTKGQVRGVQLYRGKMETRYGYMRFGVSAGESADARLVFEAAYAKAWAKWAA